MNRADIPFLPLAPDSLTEEFSSLLARGERQGEGGERGGQTTPCALSLGRLHGFDALERPLVSQCSVAPGEVRLARTTVRLMNAAIGRAVVVLEADDGPVIIGVVEDPTRDAPPPLVVQADGERYHLKAEREIVLSCGEASITLTRAGKVIIKGTYVLSRSSGYNKIKGASIDLN